MIEKVITTKKLIALRKMTRCEDCAMTQKGLMPCDIHRKKYKTHIAS